MISRVLFAMLLLSWTSQCMAGLVISEIMNNPSSANDGVTSGSDEWFELFNSSGTSIDLSTVKFDDDADASDGATLNGALLSGRYAIVANRSKAIWEGLYGTLPFNTLFVQLADPWNVLNNATGDTVSLYSTTSATNFFTLTYGASTNGTSLQYTGTSVANVTPYSFMAGRWQNATNSPGGTSGDKHSAGTGSLQAAPEPASISLALIAGGGLAAMVRRKKKTQNVGAV